MQAGLRPELPLGEAGERSETDEGLKKVWSSYQPDPGDRLRNGI